ncbi:uncharacterized protein isoform X1 [Rhodnius prolixus]|uniref:uncharacterized protein isoform X1 n=1 Tax=Rhodnius prolixus TaxID=13249 RepID=UPI003D189E6F
MTNTSEIKDASDNEEMGVAESPPQSPLPQSDSDGSISGGESSPHGQPAPIKCRWKMCEEWFTQLESLASHVTHVHAVSGKGGLFYCGWEGCTRGDRGFNARYKMLVHVRTHTNEKPHQCFQCEKSFSRAENLKIHARSHTGERPYVCPVPGCGKAYSNSSDRFKHTRTHSVDKPYMCKVPGCPKRYTDPSSLRKHVKTFRHFPTTLILSPNSQGFATAERDKEQEQTENKRLLIEEEEAMMTKPFVNNVKLEDVPETPYLQYTSTPSQQPLPAEPAPYPSMWPGVIHWWFCTEAQETPLDLTCPIKVHNKT